MQSFNFIASSQPCSHSHTPTSEKEEATADGSEKLDKEFLDIASFLEAQFGEVELNEKEKKIVINMDSSNATVDTLKFVSDIKVTDKKKKKY